MTGLAAWIYSLMNPVQARLEAQMFNRKAGRAKSRAAEIIQILGLRTGQTVIDLGSGGGYFSLRFAAAVKPAGWVYAVDINDHFLEFIREQAAGQDAGNLVTVPAKRAFEIIPPGSADLLFVRNAYHHLEDRVVLLARYRSLLKPSGRLAVIEHKPGLTLFDLRRLFSHYVKPEVIKTEMTGAGFARPVEHSVAPGYSFIIFQAT